MTLHATRAATLLSWVNSLHVADPVETVLQLQDCSIFIKIINTIHDTKEGQQILQQPLPERLDFVCSFLQKNRKHPSSTQCLVSVQKVIEGSEMELAKMIMLFLYQSTMSSRNLRDWEQFEYGVQAELAVILKFMLDHEESLNLTEDLESFLEKVPYTHASTLSEELSPPSHQTKRKIRFLEIQRIASSSSENNFLSGSPSSPMGDILQTPQSFTCPYCGKMGYTETSLQEHVTSEHAETSTEVICPICAALPGGDPNHVTDDFAAHLTLEHRAPRDLDESSGVRHVRRMFHPGRGLGGPRARRSNMHFTSSSTGGLSSSQSSYSPSSREAMDPIAELLSQLSGVRRSAGGQLNSSGPSASQLQQLQMQLQLERQHAQAARQQLETARNASRRTNTSSVTTTITQATATANTANTENSPQALHNSQFLLTRLNDPKMSEAERQSMESERADRSLFVQELLLSTLVREESSSSDEDDRGEMADFGAMGCVDIMPLDVALENLNLKESNKGNEPPPPPL